MPVGTCLRIDTVSVSTWRLNCSRCTSACTRRASGAAEKAARLSTQDPGPSYGLRVMRRAAPDAGAGIAWPTCTDVLRDTAVVASATKYRASAFADARTPAASSMRRSSFVQLSANRDSPRGGGAPVQRCFCNHSRACLSHSKLNQPRTRPK